MTKEIETVPPPDPKIYAPKVLSIGRTGKGKSYSCGTILKVPNMELVYIYNDPGGVDAAYQCAQDIGADINRIHPIFLPVGISSFAALAKTNKKINRNSYKALCQLDDVNSADYPQMVNICNAYGNLIDDNTGEAFGPASDLDPKKYMLVHDGLTGLSIAARDNIIGGKPSLHEGEWNVAMNQVERFIVAFTNGIKCMAVMIAHVETEADHITMENTIMCSTLGRKLAPKIPGLGFSEVVYNDLGDKKEADFFWSTKRKNIDVKARLLPLSNRIEPDYSLLFNKWLELRGTK